MPRGITKSKIACPTNSVLEQVRVDWQDWFFGVDMGIYDQESARAWGAWWGHPRTVARAENSAPGIAPLSSRAGVSPVRLLLIFRL
jgi:hypothetical protein